MEWLAVRLPTMNSSLLDGKISQVTTRLLYSKKENGMIDNYLNNDQGDFWA